MSLEITEDLIARQPPESQAIIRVLVAKIEELEARLNKTCRNLSKPPSSEHPHAKSLPEQKSLSKRRRGGQHGHQQFERTLIPETECEAVIPCRPGTCRGCGKTLRGTDSEPVRQREPASGSRRLAVLPEAERATSPLCLKAVSEFPSSPAGLEKSRPERWTAPR